ncbi:TonB-dependent receptor [Dyadobacter luteus]|jgi:outer membrane cobalamin receptor|uniref:TonB-dependent receptor n=1 Tax=Dyadobacter luteus TaxID=2259619 RepID=A0A3D8YG23_9BACT|nr:TonB-dependent receptor [Dyadobacter luteus]REA63227.1 TonB-dependent receptor [Dyadobacter luteus]
MRITSIFRRSLPVLFLSVWAVCAYGQTVLTGKISEDDGTELPGASVLVKGTATGTAADDKGVFRLELKKGGSYTIQVSAIGFLSQSKTVQVKAGQETSLNFTLKSNVKEMGEVVVHGKNESQQIKEQAFNVNAIETRQFANSTADMNQILNRSAGIKVREQGGVGSDFNFSINGLSGKAVKFFIDGIPMDIMGSTMSLNNIPVNLAERIEVYKGVVPVALGADALGGSVNIVTNQGVKNYLDASYSYGSFNTNQVAISGQYTHRPTGFIAKASAFYNYADNNYLMKGVEIWDETQNAYVYKDLPRFHDQYKAAMGQLELGVVNKKWADVFFVGASYSQSDKQLQTGIRQEVVYGSATKNGDAYNFSLRYKKDNFFLKGLGVNLYSTFSKDSYILADTLTRKYYWDGTYIDAGNAETGSRRVTHVDRPRLFSRANINYVINENQSINFNYTLDRVRNQTYDALIMQEDDVPGRITKHIAGLAFQQNFFNKRWSNTLFAKYYGIDLNKRQYTSLTQSYYDEGAFKSYLGYGLASVYKLGENAGVKGSYEFTYRVQDINEVFGDGFSISNNLALKPESGDNVNLGGFYGMKLGRGSLFVEGSAFYRNSRDFIYAIEYATNRFQYQNVSKVLIKGLEAEVRYSYNRLLNASVNVSYQNAIDNTKYTLNSSTSTSNSATYKNRIPNQPWFFSNADLGIGKNDVFQKGSRIQFNWSTQYTHWYYRTWEAFGNKKYQLTIPKQLVHQASVSYSMHQGKYNFSLECRNLTNELVYDNFRLQKPGRAFYAKFRLFLK